MTGGHRERRSRGILPRAVQHGGHVLALRGHLARAQQRQPRRSPLRPRPPPHEHHLAAAGPPRRRRRGGSNNNSSGGGNNDNNNGHGGRRRRRRLAGPQLPDVFLDAPGARAPRAVAPPPATPAATKFPSAETPADSLGPLETAARRAVDYAGDLLACRDPHSRVHGRGRGWGRSWGSRGRRGFVFRVARGVFHGIDGIVGGLVGVAHASVPSDASLGAELGGGRQLRQRGVQRGLGFNGSRERFYFQRRQWCVCWWLPRAGWCWTKCGHRRLERDGLAERARAGGAVSESAESGARLGRGGGGRGRGGQRRGEAQVRGGWGRLLRGDERGDVRRLCREERVRAHQRLPAQDRVAAGGDPEGAKGEGESGAGGGRRCCCRGRANNGGNADKHGGGRRGCC